MKTSLILFIILTITNIFDWWQTRQLFLKNQLIELNPIMNWMINNFGIDSLLWVKLPILSILLFALIKTKFVSSSVTKGLLFATILYCLLTIHHIIILYIAW